LNSHPLKVWFVCTGVGIYNRGIESFFRDAFDGLHPLMPKLGVHAELFKGGGLDVPPDEHRVWCLPRTGNGAKLLARIIRRNEYTAEQMSFLPGIIRRIRRHRPDVIYHSDSNMAMRLWLYRKRIGVPFRLLYSNGAPLHPPFSMTDHVQQVVPCYQEEALAFGEPASKHSMVPYGFTVPDGDPPSDNESKLAARRRLGLPVDRPIVLSVGWISKILKRMDYTISEIAAMPSPRPYLVMLGAMDEQTPPILVQANEQLGADNFTARSVALGMVDLYYQAADVFVLSSLAEGFGRVYIEALINGMPVVAHDAAVPRYVLAAEGNFADLTVPGNLAAVLATLLRASPDPTAPARRRASVRRRFSWPVLAADYAEMFKAAAAQSLPEKCYTGRGLK
jgi:1,2-diacylglycerol 3-alpha-glucosyltransferase